MSARGLSVDVRVPGRLEARFAADPGAVVAVIGPNGAGKSTLAHALAGLVTADGTATLDGRDLLSLPVVERRVGLVFQEQRLFPHLSAIDNVAFGPRSRGIARRDAQARAREWLRRVDIAHLARRRPRELSGGQAQRVAIARALATEPDLLLLDEPMARLDVGVATALRLELARHLRDFAGVTLLVTHDAVDALTIADRVLVVDEGRVAQYGTPTEVAQRPATDHVARLVGINVLRSSDGIQVFQPSAVTVELTQPRGSARHRWPGSVVSTTPHGGALRLVIRTDLADLIADVTPAAATELGLAPGREVWASVKQTSMTSYAVDSDAGEQPIP